MAECLFCAIVAGDIPATTVLETDRILAFRDIDPQAPTHVLVIPKGHYPDVAALAAADAPLLGEVITGAYRVAAVEGVGETGFRVVFNTGADRGRPSRTPRARPRRPFPRPGRPDHCSSADAAPTKHGVSKIPDNMVLTTLGGRSPGSSRASN